jgi:hypothetical protein
MISGAKAGALIGRKRVFAVGRVVWSFAT